jgi:hypothetical protein
MNYYLYNTTNTPHDEYMTLHCNFLHYRGFANRQYNLTQVLRYYVIYSVFRLHPDTEALPEIEDRLTRLSIRDKSDEYTFYSTYEFLRHHGLICNSIKTGVLSRGKQGHFTLDGVGIRDTFSVYKPYLVVYQIR